MQRRGVEGLATLTRPGRLLCLGPSGLGKRKRREREMTFGIAKTITTAKEYPSIV